MNYDTLLNILGLPLDDSLTKSILGALPETPEEAIAFEDRIHISYWQLGICIFIEGPEKVVTAIFLFAAGREGFAQFSGALPFGLEFGVSIADGLKKAGTPVRIRTLPVNPEASILKEYPFEKRTIHTYRIADVYCSLTYGKENTLVDVALELPYDE